MIRMCNTLVSEVSYHTITDDGAIICADNGEVLVTEKELYEVLDVLNNLDRIFSEAPQDANDTTKRVLAIDFCN